jgi:hypothetical protein
MGYGHGKPKRFCRNHDHRWMRKIRDRLGHSAPVGLGESLPSDFCNRCRAVRGSLEVS